MIEEGSSPARVACQELQKKCAEGMPWGERPVVVALLAREDGLQKGRSKHSKGNIIHDASGAERGREAHSHLPELQNHALHQLHTHVFPVLVRGCVLVAWWCDCCPKSTHSKR